MCERKVGTPFDPAGEAAVREWLGSLDVSERTRRSYEGLFKSFCAYVRERGLDFGGLSKKDVVAYKRYLLDERSMTPSSVSTHLTAVRSFYAHAAEQGAGDITRGVKGERAARGFKKDILTPSQTRAMLAAIDRESLAGKRDFAMLNLMVRTGVRSIEVARADVGDISKSSGADVLFVHGKGRSGKDEFVVLTPSALSPIREYLAARGGPDAGEPLFASIANRNPGARLTTRSISRIAKEAMRAVGIDDARHTAHSLRHTAITYSLLGGAVERDAQQMARHADISTTMVYSHNIDRIKNAAERNVDNVL